MLQAQPQPYRRVTYFLSALATALLLFALLGIAPLLQRGLLAAAAPQQPQAGLESELAPQQQASLAASASVDRAHFPPVQLSLTAVPKEGRPGDVLVLNVQTLVEDDVQALGFSASLPPGLEFVSAQGAEARYDAARRTVSWSAAELAKDATAEAQVQVRMGEDGRDLMQPEVLLRVEGYQGVRAAKTQVQRLFAGRSVTVTADAGGELRSADGRVRVVFPAGAVTQSMLVEHTPRSIHSLLPMQPGVVFEFELNAFTAAPTLAVQTGLLSPTATLTPEATPTVTAAPSLTPEETVEPTAFPTGTAEPTAEASLTPPTETTPTLETTLTQTLQGPVPTIEGTPPGATPTAEAATGLQLDATPEETATATADDSTPAVTPSPSLEPSAATEEPTLTATAVPTASPTTEEAAAPTVEATATATSKETATPAATLTVLPLDVPIHRFEKPFELRVDVAGLIDLDAMPFYQYATLAYLNEATGEWEELSTHQYGTVLVAEVDHLSIFGAMTGNNYETGWVLPFNDANVSGFTGALNYSYPIEVPAGRGGLTPDVTLSYNSRRADGILTWIQSDWAGFGLEPGPDGDRAQGDAGERQQLEVRLGAVEERVHPAVQRHGLQAGARTK